MRPLFHPQSLLAIALCAGAAFVLSVLCRNFAMKAAVPVTFLLALVPVALLAGRTASLAVTLAATCIFAVFLFEPYGSLSIRNGVDQIDLLCFALAAIGMVRFSPLPEEGAKAELRSSPDSVPGVSSLKTAQSLETWIAVIGYAFVLMTVATLLLQVWNTLRQ
jgi:K+-sensing histidine kinase KdpD